MSYEQKLNDELVADFVGCVASAKVAATRQVSFESLINEYPWGATGIDWDRSRLLCSESVKTPELRRAFIASCERVLLLKPSARVSLTADQGLNDVIEVPIEDLRLAFETACLEIPFGFFMTDFDDERHWVIDVRMARSAFCGMPPVGDRR